VMPWSGSRIARMPLRLLHAAGMLNGSALLISAAGLLLRCWTRWPRPVPAGKASWRVLCRRRTLRSH